jgi:hypothetical protein
MTWINVSQNPPSGRRRAHVGCESKAERYVTADVYTAVLFLIPTAFGKPESKPASPREVRTRGPLETTVYKDLFRVIMSFEKSVPK